MNQPTHHHPTNVPPRPLDVDTGFWLWLVAVPLMVIGQLADAYVAAKTAGSTYVFVATALVAAAMGGVVVGFLALLRSGYRWARTLLTGGGLVTIFFTSVSLLGMARPPLPAVIYAVTGIFGCVFIAGGIYLLHRPDSQQFFNR
ncbi:MAG: hypothetical protein KIH64_006210 [Mycobacterium sp.]|nr:hypothetical protein [Mycobacterium sp.]